MPPQGLGAFSTLNGLGSKGSDNIKLAVYSSELSPQCFLASLAEGIISRGPDYSACFSFFTYYKLKEISTIVNY